MLFTYSPLALAENWLNNTIVNILDNGMRAILQGDPAPIWPEAIPIAYRPKLRARTGIQDRLAKIWVEFRGLTNPEQIAMLEAIQQQTSLPNVLFDDTACTSINLFSNGIRDATVDLFRFLFEKQLTTLKTGGESLRDAHYRLIYSEFPSRICPFCGLGHFRAPGAPRNALDHYMPISKYPFIGTDLRNLPPMCSECNSDFKGSVDILFDGDGNRQRCVNPYEGPTFSISLANSLPFAGNVKGAIHLPRWEIGFVGGPQEQAENWDRVFKIRERYKRDILDQEFRSWLEHFVFWYTAGQHGANTGNDIAAAIPLYLETVIQDGLADRAFLKAEVFRLLFAECGHPNRGGDMKAFLEILITYT